MRVVEIPVGSRGADSLPYSQAGTGGQALALKQSGFDFFVGYLGAINKARVQSLLDAGLGFMPVTFGGPHAFNGAATVAACQALGIPNGVSVWLDLEGPEVAKLDPGTLMQEIDAWADAVIAAALMPCLYVGVPQPLTSEELYKLKVVRYWRGQGSIRDRRGALAEPTGCGWCMTQAFPSVTRGGVLVDVSLSGRDYRSRAPAMLMT